AMRLLDRYLFRELLAPLIYCLGGFLIFWISFSLFNDLDKMQMAKLHLLDVIEYSIAMTPEFLATALPVALLLALLYTLTHHARYNEITAMRAAGVSLWRICAPYFIVGLFASVALFALNECAVPRGADWADRILNRYIQKPTSVANEKQMLGFQNDRARRTWFFSKFDFRAEELDGVTVIDLNRGFRLDADLAAYTNGVWNFFTVKEYARARPDEPFAPSLQTNAIALPEFSETPREMKIALKIGEYERIKKTRTVIPLKDILDYLQSRPNAPSPKVRTQLHQHFAEPVMCLVVVLIAIPFGAASGRRNLFFGVAGSIFICFTFIILQKICFALGAEGHLPGWLAAWLPNLIFGATGIFLTTRVR
ncbi:MAG TPA: LptF/LptG family permease, partial [Candidatus Baltobacteraceae bacterium]|nr:LptF/LptG family permease [Candidatus Baltobacteraceae bacterium]